MKCALTFALVALASPALAAPPAGFGRQEIAHLVIGSFGYLVNSNDQITRWPNYQM